MAYKTTPTQGTCLECGEPITYGRWDRKFCCNKCRHDYHNDRRAQYRDYRLRLISALDRNHIILDHLITLGCSSIGKIELAEMGFCPTAVTAVVRKSRSIECRCYNIKYQDHQGKITDLGYVPIFSPSQVKEYLDESDVLEDEKKPAPEKESGKRRMKKTPTASQSSSASQDP